MNKLTSVGFMVSLLIAPLVFQTASATDQGVDSDVTISATCGLSPSPTTLNYGTVARDTASSNTQLVLTNTGSVTASVQVKGNDWTGDSDSLVHLAVGKTKYAFGSTSTPDPTGVDYASKVALTTTLAGSGVVVNPANANNTYWQVEASNMQNLPFSGTLSQTITFTFSCLS